MNESLFGLKPGQTYADVPGYGTIMGLFDPAYVQQVKQFYGLGSTTPPVTPTTAVNNLAVPAGETYGQVLPMAVKQSLEAQGFGLPEQRRPLTEGQIAADYQMPQEKGLLGKFSDALAGMSPEETVNLVSGISGLLNQTAPAPMELQRLSIPSATAGLRLGETDLSKYYQGLL